MPTRLRALGPLPATLGPLVAAGLLLLGGCGGGPSSSGPMPTGAADPGRSPASAAPSPAQPVPSPASPAPPAVSTDRPGPGPENLDPGARTLAAIAALQGRLQADPDDAAAWRELGVAFLQRARETADPSYYDRAEGAFDRARATLGEDPRLLVGIGTLELARHRFADALDTGRRAVELEPGLAAAHGVVADALVELGRYDEAVDAVQTMLDLRPDLASWARVSYLRELHGDLPGALEAMVEAARLAADPEARAFSLTLVGDLLVYTGDEAGAARAYETALDALPGYPVALAGQARAALRAGDLEIAGRRLDRAVAAVPLPDLVVAAGEVDQARGDDRSAADRYALARLQIDLLEASGVVVDVDLAAFEADHGDPARALELARRAYAERRTIRTADALAWTLYRAGRAREALPLVEEAARLGTRHPLLLYHAGTIAAAVGDRERAAADLREALALDAGFSPLGAAEARRLLQRLGG